MVSYHFSKDFIDRFSKYINSAEYKNIPNYAKSDYWEYHSNCITVEISDNVISVGGKSGYYVPPTKNSISNIINDLRKVFRNPYKLIHFLAEKLRRSKKVEPVQLLNYFDAFDAVMNHDPVAGVDLTPYRINFKSLHNNGKCVTSVAEINRIYFAKNKYQLNQEMVYAHYLSNIIRGYINKKPDTILEIGAGNGNLASLLCHLYEPAMIIVDLPETLCLSITFIADLFPDKNILMPHESHLYDTDFYDFIFLTPSQISLIKDNSVDLSINIHSFQEMTHKQIKEYFDLIQRSSKNEAYFLCCNRVEKIPASFIESKETDVPVNRFSEYPWNLENDTIVYEICKFMRLVQLDDIFICLERIRKNGN